MSSDTDFERKRYHAIDRNRHRLRALERAFFKETEDGEDRLRTLLLLAGVSTFGLAGTTHAQATQPGEQVPAADQATLTGPLRAATAPETSPQTDDRIGEIVVTASRRSETIRETPTAVSAFSGDKLQTAQITTLDQLAAMTPNVQINSLNTATNVTIRGIGNTSSEPSIDGTVATSTSPSLTQV